MGFKVVNSAGRAMGGTQKKPCKLRKTAESLAKVLQEMYGKSHKFTVVETS